MRNSLSYWFHPRNLFSPLMKHHAGFYSLLFFQKLWGLVKVKLEAEVGEYGWCSHCCLGRWCLREGVFSEPGQGLVSSLHCSDLNFHVYQMTKRNG